MGVVGGSSGHEVVGIKYNESVFPPVSVRWAFESNGKTDNIRTVSAGSGGNRRK